MNQQKIQQDFDQAIQHHQAGRLQDAQRFYRKVLTNDPQHIDATHNLGVIALQMGRTPDAVDLMRRTIALRPDHAQAWSNLAYALRNQGQIDEAISASQRAIAINPNGAEAYLNMGSALHDAGQLDQAISLFKKALALNPKMSLAHYNLGNVLKDLGQLDEAIAAYHQAIELKCDYVEVHNNLGIALGRLGHLDEAIAAYRQAIFVRPDAADAHFNLGSALSEKGQIDDAIAEYRRAIDLKPQYLEAHSNLGGALKKIGQLDQAVKAYRKAIAIDATSSIAHFNLGSALCDGGHLDQGIAAYRHAVALRPDYAEAYYNMGIALIEEGEGQGIDAFRAAIAIRPDYADAHVNLGNALKERGELDSAIAAYRQAIASKPHCIHAYNNLGAALKERGELDGAIAAYRKAMEIDPANPEHASSLILTLHYHPGYDARAIAAELDRWNLQHAEPLRKMIQPHDNDPSSERRLRVGYVSADFWTHASAMFLIPLFENHERGQVEIFCYAQVKRPDATTSRFQQLVDAWRDTGDFSDEQLAQQIRRDRIDLLVDLKLHTGANRLLVFALRPAPVQVTWLGYPSSTGMNAVDYRLSDAYLDSPGMDESIYSEKTIRLPETYWCYDPLDGREILVSPLPALERDYVTFCCLNNPCKINETVIALWVQAMHQVENSRLLLLAPKGYFRDRLRESFSRNGIDATRIRFVSRVPRPDYLRFYHQVDIALDTFPYNGHTTSLDAFWMGVPVITLVGKTAVSRAGCSQLSNLGLAELVAETPSHFVRIVAELATDLPRLKELRSTLRQRMQRSPLMNSTRFARSIEAAYRQMWRTWCMGPR